MCSLMEHSERSYREEKARQAAELFQCSSCEYSTPELRDGMSHAAVTKHSLTRAVDEEGTTMAISVALDEEIFEDGDEEDDWNAGDQW